jgi:hypothetical protein
MKSSIFQNMNRKFKGSEIQRGRKPLTDEILWSASNIVSQKQTTFSTGA